MRAAFCAEAIKMGASSERVFRQLGIDRQMYRLWRPWVARLDGPCPRHGYRRELLTPDIDYTEANSRGTRGVVYRWILDPGQFYEARYPVSPRRAAHRFMTATPEGNIIDIDEARIRAAWEREGRWGSAHSG